MVRFSRKAWQIRPAKVLAVSEWITNLIAIYFAGPAGVQRIPVALYLLYMEIWLWVQLIKAYSGAYGRMGVE